MQPTNLAVGERKWGLSTEIRRGLLFLPRLTCCRLGEIRLPYLIVTDSGEGGGLTARWTETLGADWESRGILRSPLSEPRIGLMASLGFVQNLYVWRKSSSGRVKCTKAGFLYIFCNLALAFWHFWNFACLTNY